MNKKTFHTVFIIEICFTQGKPTVEFISNILTLNVISNKVSNKNSNKDITYLEMYMLD